MVMIRPDTALSASVLAVDVDFLAVKASARGTRIANRALAPLGLRVRSYSVLALAGGPVPVTQRDLAEHLSLDPSQIVALVDELEGDGLVRREVDAADRRSRVIRATAAGEERLGAAQRATASAEEESLAALDGEERDLLRSLLQKLVFDADREEQRPPHPV